jgi:hypothetical protein
MRALLVELKFCNGPAKLYVGRSSVMDPTSEVEVRMKKLSTGRLPSLDASGPRSCLLGLLLAAVRFVASAALLTPEASAWLISCAEARRLPAHRVALPLAAVSHSMLTQFTYGLRRRPP